MDYLEARWWRRNAVLAWDNYEADHRRMGTHTARVARHARQGRAAVKDAPLIHKGRKPSSKVKRWTLAQAGR